MGYKYKGALKMGYEFGFCKKSAEESSEDYYDLKDFYFFNRGREYTDLFKAFAELGKKIENKNDGDDVLSPYEYKINVKDLEFIGQLYTKIRKMAIYTTIVNLSFFDNDDDINAYLGTLPKISLLHFKLAFLPSDTLYSVTSGEEVCSADPKIIYICTYLYGAFMCGDYSIIERLYNGYKKMKEDAADFVWLYESY